jgi:transcription initiation factor TFIIIB Brf1 subunit/transcription initiation factor TFIIB
MDLFATELAVDIPGDVKRMARQIVDVVKQEGLARGKRTPVRVILGCDALAIVRQKCEQQLKLAAQWENVSLSTD